MGVEVFEGFAEMARTGLRVIDSETTAGSLARKVTWNQAHYRPAQGL